MLTDYRIRYRSFILYLNLAPRRVSRDRGVLKNFVNIVETFITREINTLFLSGGKLRRDSGVFAFVFTVESRTKITGKRNRNGKNVDYAYVSVATLRDRSTGRF